MASTEIERTFLAAKLPEGLEGHPHQELVDVYFPATAVHPKLRIRQKGNKYVLTKKTQVAADDASTQVEENVELTRDEFEALKAGAGKAVSKVRYELPVGEVTAEVDVFTGPLEGLVLVDVEFDSAEARDRFVVPEFCGADVTQEDFIAGGMLAGKSLADIAEDLKRLDYKNLQNR